MFEFFFNEYNEKVYKEANRKLKVKEVVMIIILCASLTVLLLSMLLQWNEIITIIGLVTEVVIVLIMDIYTRVRNKKESKSLVEKYKKKRIDALADFMKKWNNNLYNISGVNWALDCCRNKLERNQTVEELKAMGQNFYMYVFPIITLCIGSLLEKVNTEQVMTLAVALAVFAFMIIFAIISIKPIVNWLVTPHRFALEILCDDLEYIKVILQEEKPGCKKI